MESDKVLNLKPEYTLLIIGIYFLALVAIALLTGKEKNNKSFFLAGRQSHWMMVAIGMIGASLSGVTFMSIPGAVGKDQFGYLQITFGYIFGYAFIGLVLMPLYYRMQLTSIYGYLKERLGSAAYMTGASFFMISRTVGATGRLFLTTSVIHTFILSQWGFPFWATAIVSVLLIWVYTFQGGIKTIVITDVFQTVFMLGSLGITIYLICQELGYSAGEVLPAIRDAKLGQVVFLDNFMDSPTHFVKMFLGGAFIAIAMTGLDQDMMQKNLTCRSLQDAQKNMFWFTIILVIVIFFFLVLGGLLYLFMFDKFGAVSPTLKSDHLFASISLEHLSPIAGIIFLLGLIAATYSSADSALAALTTSFCVDFLGMKEDAGWAQAEKDQKTRRLVHIAFSVLFVFMMFFFESLNNGSIIGLILKLAGFTYGPLLGLFAFGLFTKRAIPPSRGGLLVLVCLLAPSISYLVSLKPLFGYVFGFELLIFNGLLTFLGLLAISVEKEEGQMKEPMSNLVR